MEEMKTKRDYLSNYYKEIPSNCIFNKVATGCGGTTLEIENMNRDSIIAVPLEQLVTNKVSQYPNERTPTDFKLYGVKEGIYTSDIVDYLRTNEHHKIIVTYDSLHKVIEAIEEVKGRHLNDYFLLIDEVHYLMNNYKLRKGAINDLLKTYTLFNKWCFMTATPTDSEFMLEELKGIPVIVAPLKMEEIHIKNVRTVQVEATTKKLIDDYLSKRLQNAHIFVNSIEFIESMIKACGLTNDNCKAVWSKGNKKYVRTISGIKRSEVGDKAMKINFYTSTCFEGSDILDEEGQYIIVSDGDRKNTLIDISTSFRQILGRIRDTNYRAMALHIFRQTRYSECATYDEYKAKTVKDLRYSERWLTLLIEEGKEVKEEFLNDNYIAKVGEKYEIDRNLITYDLMKYKLANETYSSVAIMAGEQNKTGFKSQNQAFTLEQADLLKRNNDSRTKFDETFEQYSTIKGIFTTNPAHEERINLIETKYPFIYDALKLIGVVEVRRLRYNQPLIKQRLILMSQRSNENKIASVLKESGINKGLFIPSKTLKGIIKKVYETANIDKQPKASDIQKYFEAEEKLKKINGATVKGYQIIREKFIFKKSPENELQDSFKRIELKVNILGEKIA